MAFWIATGVLSVLVGGLIVLGLMRRQEAPIRDEDVPVYRDQLREVEKDVARGIIGRAEADRLRVEISRRLLEADRKSASAAAPTGTPRPALWVGVALVPALIAGSFALYHQLGAPGYSDMPLSARLDAAREAHANRPSQSEAEAQRGDSAPSETLAEVPAPEEDPTQAEGEALIAQLRDLLAQRPDDLQGHRLLASGEASLGNMSAAHQAQSRVVEILGDEARAEDYVTLADMKILAAGGYVSPEAERAIERALELDPENHVARYFTGVMMAQTGRPDLTFRIWRDLLAESPPDAPWVAPIRADIEHFAARAGVRYELPPEGAAPSASGPSAEDLAAAEEMSPQEREDMIRGMVEGLAARLSQQGGPPDDWARLIESYAMLGERDQANAVWNEAQAIFGGRPDDLAVVIEAAERAGVAQ